MGGTSYSSSARHLRAESSGFFTRSFADTFTQVKEGKIHDSMDPRKIRFREARDSEIHLLSYPIIFGMDVTGSMKQVPHMLIQDGLPHMVSKIIQGGVESPALLFLALGDSQNPDEAPFQIAQFESGDAELDMWLTRTWPEGGGGGNTGESYLWAWYFAAYHCATDAWDKRGHKGLLVTFGDEPCLPIITKHEYEEVMGKINGDPVLSKLGLQFPLKAEDLLKKAEEKWNIFHIQLTYHRPTNRRWKELLGQGLIEERDYYNVPNIVATLAVDNCSYCGRRKPEPASTSKDTSVEKENEEPIL